MGTRNSMSPGARQERTPAMNDVEEIKKLKARYFRSLDSKDWVKNQAIAASRFSTIASKKPSVVSQG